MSEVVQLTNKHNITVRTSELRLVNPKPDDGPFAAPRLQQLYKNLNTNENEWRDVECIDEPTGDTNVKP